MSRDRGSVTVWLAGLTVLVVLTLMVGMAYAAAALPALGAWLERLPAGVPVHAVVEVADPGERLALAREVHWVFRSEGGRLQDGIEKFVAPDGDGYVWVAGEALALKPIRRHVRGYGLPLDRVEVDGYWRRGAVNHDHHDLDD